MSFFNRNLETVGFDRLFGNSELSVNKLDALPDAAKYAAKIFPGVGESVADPAVVIDAAVVTSINTCISSLFP